MLNLIFRKKSSRKIIHIEFRICISKFGSFTSDSISLAFFIHSFAHYIFLSHLYITIALIAMRRLKELKIELGILLIILVA